MNDSAGAIDLAPASFQDVDWRDEYRTSEIRPGEPATDILKEFYVPALERTVRYDRVAGYFRSSSLAVASQGFTALAKNGAKARFLVGCDLDKDDVEAALRGADEGLVEHLASALENDGSWSDETVRGVDLLAYMISQEILEVKVAFRVHRASGDPISVDATLDGYVHEKWAVFVDASGDAIRIDGSLNESKTALAINAENVTVHCSWWDERSCRKAKKALNDFDHLWKHGSEGIRVMPLPDAVQARLVRMGKKVLEPKEIDGSGAKLPIAVPGTPFDCLAPADYLRWRLIKDGPRLLGGRFVGIETTPVEPWPHQAFVARRLVTSWPYSFLMCDEVGLGKTIEAGLAIRSLSLSGLAQRVLIAAPASLTRQWHREMKSKFLLDFARTAPRSRQMRHERLDQEGNTFETSEGSLLDPDFVIASTGLLTHRTRLGDVRAAKGWDIALLDEAHYARAVHKRNRLFSLVDDTLREKSNSLLLATATPLQLEMQEAFDLMRLTRRVGSFAFDDDITREYYDAVQEFVRTKGRISLATIDFLRRAVHEIKLLDPGYWDFVMSAYRSASDRRTVSRWVEDGRAFSRSDYKLIARALRAAAPLSRVMLRHTRDLLRLYRESGQLNANLAERQVRQLDPIQFSPSERCVYDALESYCRELDAQVRNASTQNEQRRIAAMGFYLSFLRLRFSSSLHAIHKTLERRLEKVDATLRAQQRTVNAPTDDDLEDAVFDADEEGDDIAVEALLDGRSEADLLWEREALSGLLERLSQLSGMPSKLTRLMAELSRRRSGNRIRQTVVFTRFKDTLDHLVDELRARMPSALVGTFSGAGGSQYDPNTGTMISKTRTAITQNFVREEIDVLICTDAAAEGLNLQTADLLINFDLPWNPAKVEQRIGRIDRIGQKYQKIEVANYAYAGSAEERVYGRLLSRLAEAGLIVGPQQIALLPVTEADFRVLENPHATQEELQRIELEAAERLKRAKAAAQALEIPPKELQDFYRAWERDHDFSSPVTLQDIDIALQTLSNVDQSLLSPTANPSVFAFRRQNGHVTFLTTSRDVFNNPPQDIRTNLEFASYGADAFEEILESIPEHAPSWMKRLCVSDAIDDKALERVAFVIASSESSREIFRVSDINGVEPDLSQTVSEGKVDEVRSKLNDSLLAEIAAYQEASRDQVANQRASIQQKTLSYEVGASFIESATGPHDADDLHRRLRDELLPNRPEGMMVRIPSRNLELMAPMLLETPAPGISGSDTNVHVSPPQWNAAEPKIDKVIRDMRRQGEEMFRDVTALRLRRKAERS
ncbi:helicase-related protein [Tropicimonas sp. TH_r6]|uniref:helicase-related protein n=1 Tax=Tropicimonas sp. TH_r6 TaxID=3082085 RepID=UPI00295331D1|nr:helicase-related protein [Tropicimonas sp. TH_r6]MDV7143514.1 helicase-related protein [Tropicimonas sp. TH_r6]